MNADSLELEPGVGPVRDPPRTRVLFVDDEPGILAGLRNALRKQRQRWDMVFVASGEEALQALRETPFDVIVSDMRMPRMDGAELLARVRREHPSLARIVLSGHAEQDAIVRALPYAHQFLIKPCEPLALQQVIDRACELQRRLSHQSIRSLVGGLQSLPAVPATFAELVHLMQDDDVDLRRVAEIIERDPAMCAKLLQLVNSSYFGLIQGMSSARQAVRYLGLDLLRGLVLSAQVFGAFENHGEAGPCVREVQREAMPTAELARRFLSDVGRGDEGFAAGLVHDVGRIVLAVAQGVGPAASAPAVRSVRGLHHEDELRELGFTHAEVGAYLLGIWGLPVSIVEAVARHHRPGVDEVIDQELVAAVHVADVLVCERSRAALVGVPPTQIDAAFVERAGLSERVAGWRRLAEADPGWAP